jgi:hypothetical protein
VQVEEKVTSLAGHALLLLALSFRGGPSVHCSHRHAPCPHSHVDKGCCFWVPSFCQAVCIGPPSQMYLGLLGKSGL